MSRSGHVKCLSSQRSLNVTKAPVYLFPNIRCQGEEGGMIPLWSQHLLNVITQDSRFIFWHHCLL